MANRKLVIEVVGDASKLDQTFKQAAVSTNKFGSSLEGVNRGFSGPSGAFLGLGRGGALAVGAGAGLLGLKSIVDAASNAQVILGQTSVAVEDAGLSWEQYGKRVAAASDQISRSSSFDDEDVLRSFQVFVRGQKDVEESLRLSELAADVARGRYTDLASATQLVNKAALGQIGALRRAGIQIDKNATSTEALAALTAAYGGAAVKYSESAAGAQDRLRVSVENLQESLGKGLLPAVTNVAIGLTKGVDAANKFGAALANIKGPSFLDIVGDISGPLTRPFEALGALLDSATGKAEGLAGAIGEVGRAAGALPPGLTGPLQATQGQRDAAARARGKAATEGAQRRNTIFDSAISRALFRSEDLAPAQQIRALRDIERTISDRIAITKDITRKLNLEDELIRVRRQRASIEEQLAEDAAERQRKAREAAQREKDILRDIKETLFARLEAVQAAKKVNDQTGPLTKTTALSTEKILAGLGLSRDDERELRARLSHFNSAGIARAGAGRQATVVQVTVPVSVEVDGKQIAKTSAKYNRRARTLNPSQRNGPNAGLIVQ